MKIIKQFSSQYFVRFSHLQNLKKNVCIIYVLEINEYTKGVKLLLRIFLKKSKKASFFVILKHLKIEKGNFIKEIEFNVNTKARHEKKNGNVIGL